MRLLIPAIVGLLLGAFPAPLSARAQAQPEILALLDRYSAGEFDAVVEAFAAIDDVDNARKDLERHGRTWAEAASPEATSRRRLVVATFALEFANAWRREAWNDVRALVEWSCELVREDPPSETERVWQLASVALVQYRHDWDVLWPQTYDRFVSWADAKWRRDDHLKHALERHPDDARLTFTPVLVEAVIQTRFWPRTPRPPLHPTTARVQFDDFSVESALETYLARADVGHEAQLRLGLLLALSLDRPDAAMPRLEAASRSGDSFISYLAHYTAGRLQESAGHPREAERHYRAALAVLPGVQSATMSLSVLLFTSGRPAEAYEIMARSLGGPPRDPFRGYGFGDYRFFDSYIAQLRRELLS